MEVDRWPGAQCFSTYTLNLDAAVAALWSSSALLDVEQAELSTWCPDYTSLVGRGVPAACSQQ